MKNVLPILNAHGGGALRGRTIPNCREAIENSVALGFKNIELDIALTSDNQFVVAHGSNYQENYTQEAFLSANRCEKIGTRLTLGDVFNLMKKYPFLHIMFDFHPGLYNRNCPDLVCAFANKFIDEDIRSRSIIEIYSKENENALKSIGFRNIMYGCGSYKDGGDVIGLCITNGGKYISIPRRYLVEHLDCLAEIRRCGIKVYSSGWYRYGDLKLARKIGVDCATVDVLVPGGAIKNMCAKCEYLAWRVVNKIMRMCYGQD